MALTQVSTKGLKDGTILNADINASAAIAGSKLNPVGLSSVGIGITSPARDLSLHSGDASSIFAHFTNTDTGTTATDGCIIGLGASEDLVLNNQETGKNIIFENSGSERMRIDSAGRLLLGVTSDSRTTSMIIQGNSSGASQAMLNMDSATTSISDGTNLGIIRFGTFGDRRGADIRGLGDGTWSAGSSHPTRLAFYTNSNSAGTPTERMRIDSSGNVRIGSGAPATFGSGTNVLETHNANSFTANLVTSGTHQLQMIASQTHGVTSIGTRSNHSLNLCANDSTKVTITTAGDCGIGITSPVVKLHVSDSYTAPTGGIDPNNALILSNTDINNSVGLSMLSATNSVSFINFGDTDDADIGGLAYFNTNNSMTFKTNTQTRMVIDSSGNCGIGTTSPARLLHLQKSSDFGIRLTKTAASDAEIKNTNSLDLCCSSGGSGGQIIRMLTGANPSSLNEVMRVDGGQKVAIGTTTTTEKLMVAGAIDFTGAATGNTANSGKLSFESGTAFLQSKGPDTSTRGKIGFNIARSNGSSGITAMTVDADGKIGINTASPSVLTHIRDSTNNGSSLEQFRISGGNRTADSFETGFRFFTESPSANGNRHIRFTSNGNTGLTIQPIETSTGNAAADRNISLCPDGGHVLIGTTTTALTTSSFGIGLLNNGAALFYRNAGSGISTVKIGGNAGEARIGGNGNLTNTNNSYGQISDENLKQDIVDAASQWNDIKNIRVRKFRFKDNPTGNLQIGVVAQELEKVSAGLVQEDDEGIKSVKYSVLYMKAVKCLQEAITKIEALETEVAALKAS